MFRIFNCIYFKSLAFRPSGGWPCRNYQWKHLAAVHSVVSACSVMWMEYNLLPCEYNNAQFADPQNTGVSEHHNFWG